MKTKLLTLTALFAGMTAICSWLSIPMPWDVPLNLATLAVFLAGAVLGPKWGTASMLVFITLGAMGIPVFAGFRGGLSVLVGPTGGYLAGYVVAAFTVGLLTKFVSAKWMLLSSMVLGLILCYALGTAWFVIITNSSVLHALTLCVLPYLAGDAVKILLAIWLAPKLKQYTSAA